MTDKTSQSHVGNDFSFSYVPKLFFLMLITSTFWGHRSLYCSEITQFLMVQQQAKPSSGWTLQLMSIQMTLSNLVNMSFGREWSERWRLGCFLHNSMWSVSRMHSVLIPLNKTPAFTEHCLFFRVYSADLYMHFHFSRPLQFKSSLSGSPWQFIGPTWLEYIQILQLFNQR